MGNLLNLCGGRPMKKSDAARLWHGWDFWLVWSPMKCAPDDAWNGSLQPVLISGDPSAGYCRDRSTAAFCGPLS